MLLSSVVVELLFFPCFAVEHFEYQVLRGGTGYSGSLIMYGVLKPKSTARPRQKANELAGFRQYIDRQYVLPAVYTSWYTYNFARLRLPSLLA